MNRISFVQVALPAAALFLLFGALFRNRNVDPAASGTLSLEERQVILDRIRTEVAQSQVETRKLFNNLDTRLRNIEQSAGARGVQVQQQRPARQDSNNGVMSDALLDAEIKVQQCPKVKTTLPKGKPARTRREVASISKADKQYGMGIVERPKPQNLVNSKDYWETRYAMGGNSGAGSYNMIAAFKAKIMNQFVKDNNVKHVIEFGFGDGAQLTRAEYPRYTGLDVSKTIFEKTSAKFKDDSSKAFKLYDGTHIPDDVKGDLTLSFDVIYHLVEDQVFANYMKGMFDASTKYVVIYSSNIEGWHGASHVLHRHVTSYVEKTFPAFKLIGTLRNDYPERTAQDFFFYVRC